MMKHFFTLILLYFIVQQHQAQNIELLSHLPYSANLSSCWGYHDTINNKEYAIVGTTSGTSIVDISNPTNPIEVAFLSGSNSSWREMKVWKHYAYIVHDVYNGVNEGMQIIDLQFLPDSIVSYNIKNYTSNGKTINLSLAHTVFIDDDGILYLNGGNTKINGTTIYGTTMFDISQTPTLPQYLGHQNAKYVHDCYAKDNYLYESEIGNSALNNGTLSIYDISNKSNPILLSSVITPFAFNHNSWTTDDGNYIFTTDEKEFAPIGIYDIHNKSNPILIGTIKNTPNERIIPHNVRVINDYLVVAHYKLGVVIWDASHPDNVIKIGQYDCSPNYDNSSSPWHGVWEAYPYFPSGNLILSDIDEGLFVLKPNYIRAARLEGTVYDSITNQVLPSAIISFVDSTSLTTTSNAIGNYKTGRVDAGTFTIKVTLNNYHTQYLPVTINNGAVTVLNIKLVPLNQIPQVNNDSVTTEENESININILANDIDENNQLDTSSITINTQPNNGTIAINDTTSIITYTPNTNFSGTDSFNYSICDKGIPIFCNDAWTFITVNPFITTITSKHTIDLKITIQNNTIRFTDENNLIQTIQTVDIVGKNYTLPINNGNQINLNNLPKGIYIISFLLKNQSIQSYKLLLH